MQSKTAVKAGSFCCFFAVALAYFTTWLHWNQYVFHSAAAIIAIVGLFLLWFALHKSWYDRMVKRVISNIEEKIDKEMES